MLHLASDAAGDATRFRLRLFCCIALAELLIMLDSARRLSSM